MFDGGKLNLKIIVNYFNQVKILAIVIVSINRVFIVVAQYHLINIFNYRVDVLLLLALCIVNIIFSHLWQKHGSINMNQCYNKYDQVPQHIRPQI